MRALGTDSSTTCDALRCNCDVGSPLPSCAPSARCVWQSIKPGKTVLLEKSKTLASAGILASLPTASIFSPRTTMTCLSSTRPPSTSTRWPALMAITGSPLALGSCAEQVVTNTERDRTQKMRVESTQTSIDEVNTGKQQPAHHKQVGVILQLAARRSSLNHLPQ